MREIAETTNLEVLFCRKAECTESEGATYVNIATTQVRYSYGSTGKNQFPLSQCKSEPVRQLFECDCSFIINASSIPATASALLSVASLSSCSSSSSFPPPLEPPGGTISWAP